MAENLALQVMGLGSVVRDPQQKRRCLGQHRHGGGSPGAWLEPGGSPRHSFLIPPGLPAGNSQWTPPLPWVGMSFPGFLEEQAWGGEVVAPGHPARSPVSHTTYPTGRPQGRRRWETQVGGRGWRKASGSSSWHLREAVQQGLLPQPSHHQVPCSALSSGLWLLQGMDRCAVRRNAEPPGCRHSWL